MCLLAVQNGLNNAEVCYLDTCKGCDTSLSQITFPLHSSFFCFHHVDFSLKLAARYLPAAHQMKYFLSPGTPRGEETGFVP